MSRLIIDESNYSIASQISISSHTTQPLIKAFHNGLSNLLEMMNITVHVKIKKGGFSYSTSEKIFLHLGPKINFLSLNFLTYKLKIQGLEKGT